MNPLLTLAIAALPAFVASTVEFVEAFTIVLAVGNTRGWRSPLWGAAAGVVALAVIVGVFGTPLVIYQAQISQSFHLIVGVLLLLFGMRWLRKAILRFAGIIAIHDEELIYQKEVAYLRAQGQTVTRWDNVGFWIAFKAVLLEGLEVAFIVLTLGAGGGRNLAAALVGALAALVVVLALGAALRHPLTLVPENAMKFIVGAMLTTFGVFWGAQGFGIEWVMGDAAILVIFSVVLVVSLVALWMLKVMLPQGALIAARRI